ncbi:MAG TPA: helix-turn-helix domain-containing protein [Nitrososphaeraceae archaeon]
MYLTVRDVAKRLNVCDQTIRIAIKNGTLRAIKLTPTKKSQWRIHPAEADAFISKKFDYMQKGNL